MVFQFLAVNGLELQTDPLRGAPSGRFRFSLQGTTIVPGVLSPKFPNQVVKSTKATVQSEYDVRKITTALLQRVAAALRSETREFAVQEVKRVFERAASAVRA